MKRPDRVNFKHCYRELIMKRKFEYKTSEIGDMNSYDIFEIGGETIAFAVKWEFVEPMIKWLNSL